MKNRNEELPWASPKSRHDTNVRPKSPGLRAGAKHGSLLTVNMNFSCVSVWSRLLSSRGCEEPNTTASQASTQNQNQQLRTRLGSPSPSPKGTRSSYPAFPADKHASSTPMR